MTGKVIFKFVTVPVKDFYLAQHLLLNVHHVTVLGVESIAQKHKSFKVGQRGGQEIPTTDRLVFNILLCVCLTAALGVGLFLFLSLQTFSFLRFYL